MDDFEYARDRVLMGARRDSMALSPKEKELTAYHEAGHAVCAATLEHADPLHKVTILPMGMALGVTQQLPAEDRHSYNQDYLEDSIVVAMGGRVAEQLVFGVVSTGANNDLVVSTERARKMVREWGMSDRIGPMAWGSQGQVFLGEDLMHNARDYSDETARVIDEEVEKILRYCEDRCRAILTENRNGLNLVARSLLEHETMNGAEVHRLVKMGRTGLTAPDPSPSPPRSTESIARALPRRPRGFAGPLRTPQRPPSRHRSSSAGGFAEEAGPHGPRGVGQHEAGHGLDAVTLVQGPLGHCVELLHGHVRRGQGLRRLPGPCARQAGRRLNTATSHGSSGPVKSARSSCVGTAQRAWVGASVPVRVRITQATSTATAPRPTASTSVVMARSVPGPRPAPSAGGGRRREVQLAVARRDPHRGGGAGPAGPEQHPLGRQRPVAEDLDGHPLGGDELVQADLPVLPGAQGEGGLRAEGPHLAVDDRAELHLDRRTAGVGHRDPLRELARHRAPSREDPAVRDQR